MPAFKPISHLLFSLLLCVGLHSRVAAQFVQQGDKLVGTGAVWIAFQGNSVSLSADGNTAIVGGPGDWPGAAWVYTRGGSVWTQQGSKLVGTGDVGGAQQGSSVSISADGNTAVVGGPYDSSSTGAVWVYARKSGVWSQQGNKLVGTGAVGASYQGVSVALSADGNTLMVGGSGDDGGNGALWVYTRSGDVWTQQGNKLVGTGMVGVESYHGVSVSLSADGNTAIVGGTGDNNGLGAAWVWTRSGGVWSQQGSKLVGTGAVAGAAQGSSVSISADGNTAIVGGTYDDTLTGAAWVYTRSVAVWMQQGSKLIGTGAVGDYVRQGSSVSISADGNTAIVGGVLDNDNLGATWVWTRSGGVWTQQGSKLVGTGAVGNAQQGVSVSLSADGSTAMVGGDCDSGCTGAAWVFITLPTGVDNELNNPHKFHLSENYPNPFNPITAINYALPSSEHVTLSVFNILGQQVAELVSEIQEPGYKTVSFDATNLPSGVYTYRITAGTFTDVKKMLVIK